MIDARAVVSSKANIGDNVSIGPFTIIEDDVTIGDGTQIGAPTVACPACPLADKLPQMGKAGRIDTCALLIAYLPAC